LVTLRNFLLPRGAFISAKWPNGCNRDPSPLPTPAPPPPTPNRHSSLLNEVLCYHSTFAETVW
jgi:hypothetical protein